MATSTAPAPIASASEETAETQAAAAALVVDSVVEGVVTNSTTATSTESTTPPEQQQQQAPSSAVKPQAPSTTTEDATEVLKSAATVQTYNNIQNSKRKERLEQNRISARESRKRKKSMIEELQRTVIALTSENKELNGRNRSLRTNLSDIGRKVRGKK